MDSSSIAISSQITLGAVFSWLLQVLKKASWFPVLTEDSTKVVKIFSGAVASVIAVTGLSYVYDSTAHTVLIQNFSLGAIGAAVWHWLTQFVMQEGWYQAVLRRVKS